MLSILPLSTVKQFPDIFYIKFPFLPHNYVLSKGYTIRDNIDPKKIIENQKYSNWQEFFFLAATSPEEKNFIQKVLHSESKASEETALHYVVNHGNWAEKIYESNQIAYGEKMHEGVLVGVRALQEKRWDFTQLLKFLEYHRMTIAFELQGELKAEKFGLVNCQPEHTLATFCDEGYTYEPLGQRMEKVIEKWKSEKDPHFENNTIIFEHNGEKIKLTAFLQQLKLILHPAFDVNSPIFKYISELYKASLEEKDQELLLNNLGKIFWLICQAKPWMRGDPSIAEMLIKTVWKFNTGKDMPPWAVDLIPWESVIEHSNPEDFAKQFASMFSTSPLLS